MSDEPLDAAAWAEKLEIFRRSVDLRLDLEGRWFHDGVPFEHPRLIELFDRGIDQDPETGETILRIDGRWCYVRAEGSTPFVVRRLRSTDEGLFADLNTHQRLSVPPDGFYAEGEHIYIRFPDRTARLSRAAQAMLIPWLEEDEAGRAVVVTANGRWLVATV